MMKFAVKMMNFALQMMNSGLQMMDYVFKMMNFALKTPRNAGGCASERCQDDIGATERCILKLIYTVSCLFLC